MRFGWWLPQAWQLLNLPEWRTFWLVQSELALISPVVNCVKKHMLAGQPGLVFIKLARALAAVEACLLCTCICAGYLPSSGGLLALDQRLAAGATRQDALESSRASSSRAAVANASAHGTLPAQNGAAPLGERANNASPARRWWRNCDSNVRPFLWHCLLLSGLARCFDVPG